MRLRHLPGRALRAGFTLVELLAVMLILGILMSFLVPKIPEALEAAKITASRKNLLSIYEGILLYDSKFERLPSESGAKFFGALVAKGVWENTPQSAKKLTCPGVNIGSLSIGELPPTEWFSDLDAIDGESSAYAGRNSKEFPLRKLSGREALVATDNDPEMNFRTTTLVLWGDGSVEGIEIENLRDMGLLGPDEDYFAVGPDSPMEELRKLSLD